MSRELAEQQGANVGSPTLRVEWPLAAPRRFAGQLAGPVRSIAADLGDRGAHIAIALAASIAALGIMGALFQATGFPPAFDLSGEVQLENGLISGMNFPALFSGALLFVAAGLAFDASAKSERRLWAPLGAFFAFMGTDELMTIHEKLEHSVGIDWQILYLPIVAVLGLIWLSALRRMWEHHSERLLWLGGAVAWIVAQMLELVANVGGDHWIPLTGEMVWVEEVLEMTGSSMFLLGVYLLVRRLPEQQLRLGPSRVCISTSTFA
jgi:hypothetical protein